MSALWRHVPECRDNNSTSPTIAKTLANLSASFKTHIACCSRGWFTCVGLAIAAWCVCGRRSSCRAVHFLLITEAPGCWSRRLVGRMARRFRGFRSSMFAMMLSSDLMPSSSCAHFSKGYTQRGLVLRTSLSLQFAATASAYTTSCPRSFSHSLCALYCLFCLITHVDHPWLINGSTRTLSGPCGGLRLATCPRWFFST